MRSHGLFPVSRSDGQDEMQGNEKSGIICLHALSTLCCFSVMVFAGKHFVPTFVSHLTDHLLLHPLMLQLLFIYIYTHLTTSFFIHYPFLSLITLPFSMEKEDLGLEITELRLGLPGAGGENNTDKDKNKNKKRVFSDIEGENSSSEEDGKKETKNQVVGWPPVCSYRKKNTVNEPKLYVKVSMDGAPFLRKIDLAMHKGYSDLAFALDKFFGCYGIGEALKDAENAEHVPIYEDKDGDWMLVGDVPWEMFRESCKRLRIMKRSDAKGFDLQPKGSLKGFIEGVRK